MSRVLWTGEGWVERERVGRREGGRESGSRGWEGGRRQGRREGGRESVRLSIVSQTHTHSPEPQEG